MPNKKELLVLCAVVLVAFFVRIYRVDRIPPAPVADEASVFYNSFSMVRTLSDEWGTRAPTVFVAFGDYKSPLYIYLTAPVIAVLDPGLTSLKLIHIIVSTLSCLLAYFFVRTLTKGNTTAAWLAAVTAVFMPWSIFFARIADDGIMLYSVLLMAGFLLSVRAVRQKRTVLLLWACVVFTASYFSYNAGRLIAPLAMFSAVIVFFCAHYRSYPRRFSAVGISSLIILAFSLLLISNRNSGINNRLSYVGIFGADKPTQTLIQQHRSDDENSLLSKMLHNKISGYSYTLIRNYASHFSPSFLLFDKGQTNMNESPYAPLNPITGIGYLAGIIYLIHQAIRAKGSDRYSAILMLAWIALSPLPSTITDAPSSKRYLGALGTVPVVSALGLFSLLGAVAKRYGKRMSLYFLSLCLLFIVLFGLLFVFRYYTQYPRTYGHLFAVRQNYVAADIQKTYHRFKRFYMSHELDGRPYIFPLFYLRTDPARLRATRSYENVGGWFRINTFDKLLFPQSLCDVNTQKKLFEQLPARIYATESEKNCLSTVLTIKPVDVTKQMRKAYAIAQSDRLYYFDLMK